MKQELFNQSPSKSFAQGLAQMAENEHKLVALSSDVGKSTGFWEFKNKFPDRFYEIGIAEQNTIGIAAGMANNGLLPFVAAFSCFASMRACEQIRTDICYPNHNVKIVATHAGLSFGPGGTTHHSTEDIAILRSFANMTIIVPADSIEAFKVAEQTALSESPAYIRLPRGELPFLYKNYAECDFEIGRATTLRDGDDLTIIASGMPVLESVKAADLLKVEGINIRVINMSTIKPIDKVAIIKAAQETKKIITVEEHNIRGGLGGAVAEVVVEHCPVPMKMIWLPDVFSTIGPAADLYKYYGLESSGIMEVIKEEL